MKKPLLLGLAFYTLLLSACAKKEPEEKIEKVPLVFPITINRVATENIAPLHVYLRGAFPAPTLIEINSAGLDIVYDGFFKDPNLQPKSSITFVSDHTAKYKWEFSCGQVGTYEESDGIFHFSFGSGTGSNCPGGNFQAEGTYGDLIVPGQTIVTYHSGKRYPYQGIRDYYYPDMASDAFPGDTIAILNYDIHFK